ncbi:MAG TPA: DinB family protein [Terriglobales bacterium]|jgi:uncharacterized damage-inducible protein DinB
MSQCALLADQIRRAFDGDAWHGDSVLEILQGVSATRAAAHPIKRAHSIWELVLHMGAWDGAVIRRAGGRAVRLSDKQNFPPVKDRSEAAWKTAVAQLSDRHRELVAVVAAFPDERLGEQVPGKTAAYYDFYYMFSGIVQHELYHAGQIALLKKA